MEISCANCSEPFVLRGDKKGYNRYSLDRNLKGLNLSSRDVLQDLLNTTFTPVKVKPRGQYLCANCWLLLSNAHRYQTCINQFWKKTSQEGYLGEKSNLPAGMGPHTMTTSTPKKTDSTETARKALFPVSSIKTSKTGKWDTIAGNVRKRMYGRALRGMYNASAGSKKQFLNTVKSLVRAEVRMLLRSDIPLCKRTTLPNIESFSWDDTFEQLETRAPLLTSALKGVVCSKKNEESLQRGKSRTVNLKPKLGVAVANLLHAAAPRTASFLPTLFSIQFWRGGLKREMIDQLSHTGICLGHTGTLSAIDNITAEFDAAAVTCRRELENQLSSTPEHTQTIAMDDEQEVNELSLALSTSINIDCEENLNENDEGTRREENDSGGYDSGEDDSEDQESEHEEYSDEGNDKDKRDEEDVLAESGGREGEGELSMPMDIGESAETSPQTGIVSHTFQAEPLHPGFTLCWDNVGKKVMTRHPTPDTQNVYINNALAYMAVNRVPTTHLDNTTASAIPASDIDCKKFIPSDEAFLEVKNRMVTLVSRILIRHLRWFNIYFDDCLIQHLIHEHSVESTRRSVLINLGVYEENPSSTQGAIGIYTRLHKYVPEIGGKPYPTVVFGDGLSCERGNDAHKARCNEHTPIDRLEGLQPCIQEFHKEMILLQDHFDEFYKGASAADRGTLFHVKNVCNFRSVKSDIGHNFNHSWELMCQQTEAFVCLLALEMLGMKTKDDRPLNAPDEIEAETQEERRGFLENTATELVDSVWHDMDRAALKVESKNPIPVYCCEQDIDDGFIGCASRNNCIKGEWFHYSCAGVDADNVPGAWYCSTECKENKEAPYPYCHCHRDLGTDAPMIGCAAEDKCTRKEWYHFQCFGMVEGDEPDGDWFCSEACRKIAEKTQKAKRKRPLKKQKVTVQDREDYKNKYSLAILWSGLNLLCRRDAVREADGEAMMCHWAIDLIQFYRLRHVKYVILAHRLLAAISGWQPEKIRSELILNRTINYSGGIGRNLPADLMNEIFNRLFKDVLAEAKGNYTSKTVARCGRIVGPLGEALDVVFDSKIIEREIYRHRRRDVSRDGNVERIIHVLKGEKLFKIVPRRKHRSFPTFKHSEDPLLPGKFLSKMRELSKRLDTGRRVVINA